jgi:hypothetical protein
MENKTKIASDITYLSELILDTKSTAFIFESYVSRISLDKSLRC